MESQKVFRGKVAIITGGTSGIGLSIAQDLSKRGATVVIAGRSVDAGHAAADTIRATGGISSFVATDVTDAVSCAAMVETTQRLYGRLDFAVNNAGGHRALAPIDAVSTDEADWVFDLNLKGVWYCSKYEIAAMLRSGGGSIVNNASIFGTKAMANLAHYVAAKHGVVGLTRAVALDYAARGIRINAVAPGPIKTPAYDRITGGDDHAYDDAVPMHHIGRGDDVAAAVCFLLSEEARYITGTVIAIDGGMSAA